VEDYASRDTGGEVRFVTRCCGREAIPVRYGAFRCPGCGAAIDLAQERRKRPRKRRIGLFAGLPPDAPIPADWDEVPSGPYSPVG
jgi:predicted RNA-binding Zn-ribbon protein involved in translation (DUF1610 family)